MTEEQKTIRRVIRVHLKVLLRIYDRIRNKMDDEKVIVFNDEIVRLLNELFEFENSLNEEKG